jgi:hypothetical protein
MEFTRLTGHMHQDLRTVLSNYLRLTAEMVLSQEEIVKRIWAIGIEAGFDREGYPTLLGAGLKVKVTVGLAQLFFAASFFFLDLAWCFRSHNFSTGAREPQKP